jgi:hypothetical protein
VAKSRCHSHRRRVLGSAGWWFIVRGWRAGDGVLAIANFFWCLNRFYDFCFSKDCFGETPTNTARRVHNRNKKILGPRDELSR